MKADKVDWEAAQTLYDTGLSKQQLAKRLGIPVCRINAAIKDCKFVARSGGGMKYTPRRFIAAARKAHGDKYDYSKTVYVDMLVKITIICVRHGEFEQRPSTHLEGKGCRKCYEERISKTTQQFILDARRIHGEKFDYSLVEYKNNESPIEIICHEHGVFRTTPRTHLSGENGCRQCWGKSLTKSRAQFICEAIDVHGNKYDYSATEYSNASTKVKIGCRVHGEFEQLPLVHLNGHEGCKKCFCKVSKAETEFLDLIGIPPSHRNVWINIDGSRYNVDAIDFKNKIVYEFNGNFWHGNPRVFRPEDLNKRTKTTYGQLYERTRSKQEKLEAAGYEVMSIWEDEFDDFKKMLIENGDQTA